MTELPISLNWHILNLIFQGEMKTKEAFPGSTADERTKPVNIDIWDFLSRTNLIEQLSFAVKNLISLEYFTMCNW